ncbi:MAG TPA: hypothetical protein PLV85_22510, partial [Polyangiaceae bacterium]|nr:hypothetical protein [Polyangiaceae bacterium]
MNWVDQFDARALSAHFGAACALCGRILFFLSAPSHEDKSRNTQHNAYFSNQVSFCHGNDGILILRDATCKGDVNDASAWRVPVHNPNEFDLKSNVQTGQWMVAIQNDFIFSHFRDLDVKHRP